MASKDAPAPDIMNVRELIEFAFGDFEKNTVNFKIVQTVLLLIARQLRLLERRVLVEVGPSYIHPSDTTLSVTEVKIHAAQKSKKKTDGAKPNIGGAKQKAADRVSEGGAVAGVGTGDGTKGKKTGRSTPSDKTTDRTTSSGEKTSPDKTTSSGEKTYPDRTTSSGKKTYPDKTTSSGEKTSTDRTTSSGEKTYPDRTTSSDEKIYPDRTTSSGKKTYPDRTTSSGEKAYPDRTTSSGEKTYPDRTTSTGEKSSIDRTTSSGDKTSTDKTAASGRKTSVDRSTPLDEKTSTDRTTSSGEKTYTDKTATSGRKTSADRLTSSAEKSSIDRITSSDEKTYSDKTAASGRKTSADRLTSSAEKSSIDRTASSGEKTYTDKTAVSGRQTSADRSTSSGEKSSIDRTTSSGEKTSADRTTTSGEKTSTDKTTASGRKSSTDRLTPLDEKTSTDRTASSGEKTSTDKAAASGRKSSTDRLTPLDEKTSTDRTTSSGEKSYTDKTAASGRKTSADRSTSSGEKFSIDRPTSSGEKTYADKTAASGRKTSTDRLTSSTEKAFTDKTTPTSKTTSSYKPSSKTTLSNRISTSKTTLSSKDAKPDSNRDTLETLEEQRERVLRIIHQRTDSFEETTKTPTPMASVSSIQYEKLLVVKQVPSSETRLRETKHGRTPRISVVTQEQFEQVADAVRQLQKKLLPVGTPGFPEHAELMEELRRGASLTDAMAALQLSARLEATEKTLDNLISMVTDLALKTPGVQLHSETRGAPGIFATPQRDLGIPESHEVVQGDPFEGDTFKGDTSKGDPLKGDPFKVDPFEVDPFEGDRFEGDPSEGGRRAISGKGAKGSKSMTTPTDTGFPSLETAEYQVLSTASGTAPIQGPTPATALEPTHSELVQNRFIIHPDLEHGAKEMYDEMINKLNAVTARTSTTAENAYKLSVKLERRLESALQDTGRMADLENIVKQYAERINSLDTGLSSQMTNYQEQLTQMQHDLEIGLDTMAEVLGNSGGDSEAIAELHLHFTSLQADFDVISFRQKELKAAQNSTAYDLENLWREIEMLRDTKSDREEVADALRDKAGICELNGLVSIQQFEAVRGDFQKRIRTAYDKFNNQENIWQKAIEDTFKVLNEKADLVQVYSLKDEIHKYLNRIKDRMQTISDVVGEPKSAMLTKKVFRDTSCLSCGTPAYMDVQEPAMVPALPKFPSARQPAEGAEAESETKGGGDYGPCYPGLPISHPRDPRSHICKRYCGGSHTLVTDGLNLPRALPGLVVQQARKTSIAAPGTDGKMYLMVEQTKKVPCLPCNSAQPPPPAQEPEPQKEAPMDSIGEYENISLTPPAHEISNN